MFNLLRFAVVLIFSISFAYASKIVSVGGSITETIVALGHQDDLIGVDLSSAYPKEVTQLPNIGYWLDLPQEGILSLKPEVVITSEQAGPKKLIDSLPSYGIKTHIISDEATLESAKNKINQIAKILNEEKKAQEIIERMQNNISKMQNEIKDKTKPKVLFLFSRGEGTTMAAGTNTKAGVMIDLAGGKNVVSSKQFSQISKESVLQMNPDVVITSNHTGDIGIDKNVILATNAGKNGQIYDIDMILISGFTVRTDVALQQLSCMFFKNELSYCSK
ncbi:heme/hemin ABC transporter substrate-binding protein [Aliarcobacter cryaerophilus]|uniref:heme/hemin ABC transporter substrate-binding protein n=1 Tax=Aliarcobacter cryaerophilus TaxID=28198 RepID=UPI0021B17D41|nr:ABC transporter substrate-binding protein [Aliarcobacter cryaerophilus]MCT7480390.1 ABC transporter substrate-binding protein [Aliarcobacter cryaerophilus]MCT7484730.1 ABC transporter substrate-binding protein [Aliarcobacter cryaerophilus]MCT7533771.1 ABC transporter substrate-binding protein [Aliarcobacter cryaerophilus]MCT7544392.1 ABC transporter substrate-binding protein [Aliarcobacter cryaerophilus]